ILLVIPQATRALRPMTTAGTPTYAMPTTSNDPPDKPTSCQQPVVPKAMCGSLDSSGRPVVLRLPPTAQLLLPPSSPVPAVTPKGSGARRAGAYDPDGTMVSRPASGLRNSRYSASLRSVRLASSGSAMTNNRPVRYQRNSARMAVESNGDHGSGV